MQKRLYGLNFRFFHFSRSELHGVCNCIYYLCAGYRALDRKTNYESLTIEAPRSKLSRNYSHEHSE